MFGWICSTCATTGYDLPLIYLIKTWNKATKLWLLGCSSLAQALAKDLMCFTIYMWLCWRAEPRCQDAHVSLSLLKIKFETEVRNGQESIDKHCKSWKEDTGHAKRWWQCAIAKKNAYSCAQCFYDKCAVPTSWWMGLFFVSRPKTLDNNWTWALVKEQITQAPGPMKTKSARCFKNACATTCMHMKSCETKN